MARLKLHVSLGQQKGWSDTWHIKGFNVRMLMEYLWEDDLQEL